MAKDKKSSELDSNELETETSAASDTGEQAEELQSDSENTAAYENEDYEQKIIDLNEKISDLKQRMKDDEVRALANIQNLQRRHKNELEDAHKYAATKFAKEMLPISDYLEMALLDQSNNFESLKKGVELTLKQLETAFSAAAIEKVNPLGEVFDPNVHNAVRAEKSEEAPNTVIQVLQNGFKMKDRILRPAMVVVATAE